jgi:hypothetical protein
VARNLPPRLGRPGGAICDPTRPDVAIAEPLSPQAGESVTVKSLPSRFARTTLAKPSRNPGEAILSSSAS